MRRIWVFGLATFSIIPCAAARDIRVGLFQKELPQTMTISAAAGLHIVDSVSHRPLVSLAPSELVVFEKAGDQIKILIGSQATVYPGALRITSAKTGSELKLSTPRTPHRSLIGVVEIEARPRELLAIHVVSSEDYLSAVIAGELPRAWPMEAFKAQAVVARTYILKNKGRHRSDRYDFCDLAHCQVYRGRTAPNPAVDQAVLKTHGQVLQMNGSPIEVFFHSACGGHTASVEDVWKTQAQPYLVGQSDQDPGSVHAFCRSSPDYRWHLEMDHRELGTLLAFAKEDARGWGTLTDFEIRDVAPSGWVREIHARFTGGTLRLSGYEFYLLWGRSARWHELKSGFFTVSKKNSRVAFEGRGLGHGIGLCQWGANGRARAGFDYQAILSHYFPGARLEHLDF